MRCMGKKCIRWLYCLCCKHIPSTRFTGYTSFTMKALHCNAILVYAIQVPRKQEGGSQKSEVRSQKSEVRSQKSEVRRVRKMESPNLFIRLTRLQLTRSDGNGGNCRLPFHDYGCRFTILWSIIFVTKLYWCDAGFFLEQF